MIRRFLTLGVFFFGCSGGGSSGPLGSGGAATGGTSMAPAGTGGGGASGTGGAGMAATGGSSGSGGAPASGGSSGSGGAPAGSGGSSGNAGSSDASTGPGGAGGAGDNTNADAAAGPTDGGRADAASVADAKTTGAGCTGLLFCDDFESYAANAAPNGKWTTQARGSAKAVVDTTMAYSGTKSVHFTGTVNQSSANIVAQGAPVFPVQGNTVFVRMMMYVSGFPATSGVHTRIARIGTSTNGLDGTGYAMATYNGTGIERINEAMVRDTSLHMTDALVKGKWVCWEWEVDNTAGPPSGGKGKVLAHLWRDGTAVTLGATSHTDLSWDPVAWQLLEFGLEGYQSDTQAGDFWIDDVALNNQKIGCPSK